MLPSNIILLNAPMLMCNAATISRIQQIFGSPVFALVLLHLLGASSQGIFNAIVYGFTPSVREAFHVLLVSTGLFPCLDSAPRKESQLDEFENLQGPEDLDSDMLPRSAVSKSTSGWATVDLNSST